MPDETTTWSRRPRGCLLAMAVLQSDLYHELDPSERAECDELVRQNIEWVRDGDGVKVAAPTPDADAILRELVASCDAVDAALQNFTGDDDEAVQERHRAAWTRAKAHVADVNPCATCGGSGEVRGWETIHGKRRAVVNNCPDCTGNAGVASCDCANTPNDARCAACPLKLGGDNYDTTPRSNGGVKDCGEAGHAEGRCGNAQCLPGNAGVDSSASPSVTPAWVERGIAIASDYSDPEVKRRMIEHLRTAIPAGVRPSAAREPLSDAEIRRLWHTLMSGDPMGLDIRLARLVEHAHGIGVRVTPETPDGEQHD